MGRLVDTAESVHHEGVRAQPGRAPPDLPRETQDALWTEAALFARRDRRGVVTRRTGVDGAQRRIGSGTGR